MGSKPDRAEERARSIVLSVPIFCGDDVQRELIEKVAEALREFSAKKPAKPRAPGTDVSRTVGLYASLWESRWSAKPVITGKDSSLLRSIVKDVGEERTAALLNTFFTMTDKFFIQRRHDVWCFYNNLKTVAHFAETGQQITQSQLNSADRTSARSDQMRRVLENKL
jgi:hypothetical protein